LEYSYVFQSKALYKIKLIYFNQLLTTELPYNAMGRNRNSTSGEDSMPSQVKLLVAQAIEAWKQE